MTEKDLLDLKQQIDDAKQSVSELKGEQTAILRQIKDSYKCATIEEAHALAEKKRKEIAQLQQQIEQHEKELEAKYNV